MNLPAVRARQRRLMQLVGGLEAELTNARTAMTMTTDEREAYRRSLRDAIEGLNAAWRALATVAGRMEEADVSSRR